MLRGSAPAPGVASAPRVPRAAGAESPGGETPNRPARRTGNAPPQGRPPPGAVSAHATRGPVKHQRVGRVNPDASLSVAAPGSDAGARHAAAAPAEEQAGRLRHRQPRPMSPGWPPTNGRYLPTARAQHGPGCGTGDDCRGCNQCRTCLNGTDPLEHGAALVTPGNAPPCTSPLQPAAVHRPRWRLPAVSAN